MREVQDHYFRQAKREGYVSRAAYKLIEIDDRKKILRPGARVLDCGAAPGSWLQVAAKRIGPKGVVAGVDLVPIKTSLGPNVHFAQGDVTTIPSQDLFRLADTDPQRRFDAILSDMAPQTTGDPFGDHHRSVRLCHALLDRCAELLKSGGNLVMKVFEGEAYADLLKRTQSMFQSAKGFKPKASRSESIEMYVVGTGFRSPTDQSHAQNASHPLPARKPSAGWARD